MHIVKELWENPESVESNIYLHGMHSDSGTFADYASKRPVSIQEVMDKLGTGSILETYDHIKNLKPEIISQFTKKFKL